jgi:Na+-transporting NADH:ubiquinone oxidoreductase subunit C
VNVDTLPRILAVAAGVALFCSAMVSATVYFLRPMQLAFESLERNRAVLEAGGLLPDDEISDREIVARFLDLDARVVDLDAARFASGFDGRTFDHWQATEQDDAAAGERRYVPVYLVRQGDRIARIVLPVDGKGMWSRIYGYIALDSDFNTIVGVSFHRHGETPGIGDRIQDASWLESWRGKRLRDADGQLEFRVTKNASGPFEVDVVSGASVSTGATGEIVRTWFGEDGYGPFLEKLPESER